MSQPANGVPVTGTQTSSKEGAAGIGKASQTTTDSKADKPKASAGIKTEDFWENLAWFLDHANRDQKIRAARLISGDVGATLVFPTAREGALRKENLVLAERLGKDKKPVQVSQKPNPMKNTQEEKNLHLAQKAIRDKRLELGLAKDAKDDVRLATLVEALKSAKQAFDARKASLKKV